MPHFLTFLTREDNPLIYCRSDENPTIPEKSETIYLAPWWHHDENAATFYLAPISSAGGKYAEAVGFADGCWCVEKVKVVL